MRNIIFIFFILGFLACSNENNEGIIAKLPDEAFSFKPIAGGAIMHYTLPDDPSIVGIYVRYKDAYGNDILRSGSNLCDSLKLIGFNESQQDIPAQVSFYYNNDQESQPFDIAFSTRDSGPVSFLKNLEVTSNWGGFSLTYDTPEETSGMAHVFYLGTNPQTNKPDTILINSFLLQETNGQESTNFKVQQDIEDLTVIVRTEDFRGYIVNEKTWPSVRCLHSTKMSKENFTFYCDNAIEDPDDKLGIQYLFDGDTKGLICWEYGNKGTCCSFLAGPDAAGENAHPMYFDLKTNRILASLRIYNLLKNSAGPTWLKGGSKSLLCFQYNENELPREVTLYARKDDGTTPASYEEINSLEGWEEVGTFKQDKYLYSEDRWCATCWGTLGKKEYRSKEELEIAKEEFLEISIPLTGQEEGYRYLKMVINDVFNLYMDPGSSIYENYNNYVQFHELEIYTD